MVTVRAKFVCNSVHRQKHSKDGAAFEQVTLVPVTTGSEENKAFWKASPSGELKMTIANPNAHGLFVPGQDYYIDFTPADA